jgi:presenilin-like A22 family membrane protease
LTEKQFKAKAVYLTPIVASLAVAFLCGFLILYAKPPIEAVTPFPDTGSGALGNALIFLVLVSAGASLLYLSLRRFGLNLVKILIGSAFTASVFILSIFYIDLLLYLLQLQGYTFEILVLSILLTFFADYCVFLTEKHAYGLVLIFVGGALGALLGASIPTLSALLLLVFLAVYDVFAVFRGPVGKIAKEGLSNLKGISVQFMEIEIGLGDLTFYALFVTHALISFGLISSILVTSGILAGCYLSFKMLERKGLFPGLPFSIALGFISLAFAFLFPSV